MYASQPLSPVATQHSLTRGRCSLLGSDLHRLDRSRFPLTHLSDHLVAVGEERERNNEETESFGQEALYLSFLIYVYCILRAQTSYQTSDLARDGQKNSNEVVTRLVPLVGTIRYKIVSVSGRRLCLWPTGPFCESRGLSLRLRSGRTSNGASMKSAAEIPLRAFRTNSQRRAQGLFDCAR